MSAAGLVLCSVLAAGCGSSVAALPAGSKVPALSSVAHDGTAIDLANLGGQPTVIYFYPKDGTPGCTKEACAFRDVWQRYEDANVGVVGVSADSPASHQAFAKEHELPFPLVSDEDGAWAKAFGVDTTMGMAHRDSFLIGKDGTIAKVYAGVDPGVHADEVLADAAKL